MKEEELKKLLEKYYDGVTSREEEMELRKFFSGDDVFQGYEAEKEIFSGYSDSEKIPFPSADFEERIKRAVDVLERKQRKNAFRKIYVPLLSAAALFLLLIGSYFIFIYKSEPGDTYTDPHLAYAETMKILNEISVKLNKGTYALQPINKINSAAQFSKKSIDKSALIISNSLKRIIPFSQLADTEVKINKKNNN